jgi:hypothetical protein
MLNNQQELAAACSKIQAHRPELPETSALIDAFKREKTIWSDENLRNKDLAPDKTKLGNEFMSALVNRL